MNQFFSAICVFVTFAALSEHPAMGMPADEQSDRANIKVAMKQPEFDHRLVVKFMDNAKARAHGDSVSSPNQAVRQLCDDLMKKHGVKFKQLLLINEQLLTELQETAFDRSGRRQPDLAAMMIVDGPVKEIQVVAEKLHASELVEWVEFEMKNPPPPVCNSDIDIAPPTPNYDAFQGYRGPNPGLNTNAFWSLGNATGQGIRLADCEYWFNGDHEDLCDVTPEPGQTPPQFVFDNGWHEHGTAALGISIGGDNGYGITGLAPEVDAHFFPEFSNEFGSRRTTAIANAIANSEPGDIVLLEMQTIVAGDNFGPAELSSSVWNVVRLGTDMGVIIVAAAGNGNQNLDSSTYSFYRLRGDSGSIIVGAGTASAAHNKMSFSTFGERVDVQGWGTSVFTTGYGGFSQIGGDFNQRYTSGFNGTSSASAMVAGVCASLQSYAAAEIGRRLDPAEMRQVLKETGWPQGTGGNIGNFPNLVEAAQYIVDEFGSGFELGDVNRDGAIDLLDVQPFIDVVLNSTYQQEADINGDGDVSLLDVSPFIDLVLGN